MIGAATRRALPILRRAAESRMTITGTVTRTAKIRNPATGKYTESTETVIESTIARLQTYEAYEQTPEAGAHVTVAMRMSLHLPVAVTGAEVGDYFTVVSTTDPAEAELVGRVYRIAGDFTKVDATAKRYPVEWQAA